jgi:predicted acyltransferase
VQDWWWSSRIPWALAPSRLSLLVIIVPGTIAGDAILRWIRARDTGEDGASGWSGGRRALLAVLAAAYAPVLTIGMYNRAGLLTTQLVLAMSVAGIFLTARPSSSLERMLRSLFLWGAAWLVLGLWMEPFEGGMKKVPETLSYFFAVTGVSVMLLVALTAVVDGLGRRRWVSALIDVGHNPMLCYVLYTVLLNSALEMIPAFRGVLRQSAGEIVLRMVLETLAVILIVRFFARRRIYWRT